MTDVKADGWRGISRLGRAAIPWNGPLFNARPVVSHREVTDPRVITVLLLDIILGIAVLVLLIYRQLSIRPVNASALRLIAILMIIGLLQTVQFLNRNHAHPLTFAAIGGSLVLAAIFGALRASTIRVWFQDGQAWSQGNWLTAALWIAPWPRTWVMTSSSRMVPAPGAWGPPP